MADHKTVLVRIEDGVGFIAFNRPEKRNALNPLLHREMNVVLDQLIGDDGVRVIILTGAGRDFCSGNDLKEFFLDQFDSDPVRFRQASASFASWREKLRTSPKPTIAAVNGWCLGGGMSIMCLCDFAIGGDDAKFGLPEINFGIFPAGGATKGPMELLSHRDVLDMVLTGRNLDAAEAVRLRLINRSVPADALMDECIKLAAELKKKDPVALMIAKETFWREKELNYPNAVDFENGKQRELNYLQNGQWVTQGIRRFMDKQYKTAERSFTEVPDKGDN
jgi:trans-feruloyl-CoA hydratase/vanillin synthase